MEVPNEMLKSKSSRAEPSKLKPLKESVVVKGALIGTNDVGSFLKCIIVIWYFSSEALKCRFFFPSAKPFAEAVD